MALTYQEIKKREEQVQKLLDEGKSISQMAVIIGITQQSMHKFLTVRGWQTAYMKSKGKKKKKGATEEQKAARRALKKVVDRD